MRLKSGQDLVTGLMFIAIGIGALVIGADYPLGTAQRPGTGVLPRILSWCLIGTGVLLSGKALLVQGNVIGEWAWRPVIMITLATIAFALLVDPLGLVLTMVVSMTIAALGTPETRWGEFALFSLFMIFVGVALFIWGLGMPIKTWPPFVVMVLPWR
jgi:hypothetical protein